MDHIIRKRAKIASVFLMVGGAAIAYWKLHAKKPVGTGFILAAFALAILFVVTRKSHSYRLL